MADYLCTIMFCPKCSGANKLKNVFDSMYETGNDLTF